MRFDEVLPRKIREKNYEQIEKEMLAEVYGLEKYHHYVYGREVIVYTDHKPLVNIKQKSLAILSKHFACEICDQKSEK